MEELAELAADRENWNKMVNAIKYNEDTNCKHTSSIRPAAVH